MTTLFLVPARGRLLNVGLILAVMFVFGIQPASAQDPIPPNDTYIDQEGRYKLLATTTLIGALEGAMIPVALGSESDRTISSLTLAGASAGFFVPFMLTMDRPVTEAQATFTLYGGIQGALHGVGLAALLGGDHASPEVTAAIVGLTTAAQSGAGYVLSERLNLSAGTGELLGYGSAYGAWSGILMSLLLFGDAETPVRAVAGLGLAGSLGGNYASWLLSQHDNYTQGDARILARTGLLGVQAASTVLVLAENVDPETFALVQYAGTFAGLGAGYFLSRGRDFTRSEANIIFLGSVAGSLFTSAIAFGLNADSDTYAVAQLLGSAAGFGLTYLAFNDDATRRSDINMSMQLSPTLLYAHVPEGTSHYTKPVPGVNLNFTF